MRTKLSQERSQRSIKFLVALELMSAEVSTVLFFPCSVIGKVIDLLLGLATSTRSRVREGDVEASSLFKNPMLLGVETSAISSMGSSKQVVRTSRMLDSLFPEVLSELTYSSRADLGVSVNGFLEGSAWVRVALI